MGRLEHAWLVTCAALQGMGRSARGGALLQEADFDADFTIREASQRSNGHEHAVQLVSSAACVEQGGGAWPGH